MRSAVALALLTLLAIALSIALLPPGEQRLTLAFAGDMMLGRSVGEANAEGGWDEILAALAPYATAADLAFANLESPLTGRPLVEATYDLRASPEAVVALQSAGFDLVSLANNHALDAGSDGLDETLQALQTVGIGAVGHGDEVLHSTVQHVTLAWIAFDDVRVPLDAARVFELVANARGRGDLLIVSIHWGSEFERSPSDRQRMLAEGMAAAGADLIVGHHAHVLQPVEWIWGLGRGRPTLVAYGLGNAVFDQGTPPQTRLGVTLLVMVGTAGVLEVEAIPHAIEPGSWRTVTAGPLLSTKAASSLNLACEWVRGCQ